MEKSLSWFILFLIGIYRTIGTTHLGGSCRFEPSCSQYAIDAVHTHNPLHAIKLIITRLLKCRPGGPFGFDPVPEKKENQSAKK